MVAPEALGQPRAAGGEADVEGRFRRGGRARGRGLVAHVAQCCLHAGMDLGGPVRVGHGRTSPAADDGQEIDQQRQRIGGAGEQHVAAEGAAGGCRAPFFDGLQELAEIQLPGMAAMGILDDGWPIGVFMGPAQQRAMD